MFVRLARRVASHKSDTSQPAGEHHGRVNRVVYILSGGSHPVSYKSLIVVGRSEFIGLRALVQRVGRYAMGC